MALRECMVVGAGLYLHRGLFLCFFHMAAPPWPCPRCAAVLPCRFELAVYTMGDRDYGREMAKLLDPQGRLFHGRVISSVRGRSPAEALLSQPASLRLP